MAKRTLMLYLVSFFSGFAGAWVVSVYGHVLGLLDEATQRSSHEGTVPRGGGIGILAAFLMASWANGLPHLFWASAAGVSLVSFFGDFKNISPEFRLGCQLVGSGALVFSLVTITGHPGISWLLFPFFVLFLTGTANFYNFMDGINGIAAIAGVVAFSLISWFAYMVNTELKICPFALSMALACLGFLPLNLLKAKVFMGDVGSILLGFVYAALVIELSHNYVDFLFLCSFLFPFYADELITVYTRLKDRENLFTPHRRHIYQILANDLGLAHWKVSAGYGLLQLAVGIGAFICRKQGDWNLFLFLSFCFVGFFLFNIWVKGQVKG